MMSVASMPYDRPVVGPATKEDNPARRYPPAENRMTMAQLRDAVWNMAEREDAGRMRMELEAAVHQAMHDRPEFAYDLADEGVVPYYNGEFGVVDPEPPVYSYMRYDSADGRDVPVYRIKGQCNNPNFCRGVKVYRLFDASPQHSTREEVPFAVRAFLRLPPEQRDRIGNICGWDRCAVCGMPGWSSDRILDIADVVE